MAIDWSKPIETVDGKPARLLGELLGNPYNMVVAIDDGDFSFPNEKVLNVTKQGEFNLTQPFVRNKKQKVWVNLYKRIGGNEKLYNSKEIDAFLHLTEKSAIEHTKAFGGGTHGNFLATVEVEI